MWSAEASLRFFELGSGPDDIGRRWCAPAAPRRRDGARRKAASCVRTPKREVDCGVRPVLHGLDRSLTLRGLN